MKKYVILYGVLFIFSGCAIMHHTQVGEVDSDIVLRGQKFEVKVSEMGFSTDEAAGMAKVFSGAARNSQKANDIETLNALVSMFQFGPKTGKPTFTDEYADKIYYSILEKCPSGKVSGITSVRETASYPVVSGEIVKIIGYCKR